MVDYSELFNYIEISKDIAIFMHINPDGDSISAALAVTLYLEKMGKCVDCFAPDFDRNNLPDKFCFLPSYDKINAHKPIDKYDLCIGVDLGDEGRLGDACYRLFLKGQKTFVIDHHSSYRNFADNTIRDENAASTTQILYKIFKNYNAKLIDNNIASCLYTGLVTDSGCFAFSNTTTETHEVASDLLAYDFNASEICRSVMKDVALNVFLLKARVMSNLEIYENGRLAYIFISPEDLALTGTTEKDTEGFVNTILDIVGVELSVAVTQVKDKAYKVSFRSKGKVDASACARCFGGGGHFNASGCRVYGYYEDVQGKILAVAGEMLSYA